MSIDNPNEIIAPERCVHGVRLCFTCRDCEREVTFDRAKQAERVKAYYEGHDS